jgi:chemotaxis protein MotA
MESALLMTSDSSAQENVQETTQVIRPRRTDRGLLVGAILAAGALLASLSFTGISFTYFFNPTAAALVVGGTFGILVITTPAHALLRAWKRVISLTSIPDLDREQLCEEIVHYAKLVRQENMQTVEKEIENASTTFLRDGLLLALDVRSRPELEAALETELRLIERQGETDAKVLEGAGGFVPTIGIIGTVIGLIDVMRHFSNLASVGSGIATAFVSTIYGLVLANFLLLPIAQRIRWRVAATFEIQELVIEGVLCVYDKTHPTLVRARLAAFLRSPESIVARIERYDLRAITPHLNPALEPD